jgi:hypothetical protein
MGIEFIGTNSLVVQDDPTSFTVNYPAGVQPGDTVFVLIYKHDYIYNYLPQANQWYRDFGENWYIDVFNRTIGSDTSEMFSTESSAASHLAIITLAYRNLARAFTYPFSESRASAIDGPSPGSKAHIHFYYAGILSPTEQYLTLYLQSTRHYSGTGDVFTQPGDDPLTFRQEVISNFGGQKLYLSVSEKILSNTSDVPQQNLTLSWELVGTSRNYESLAHISYKHSPPVPTPGAPKLKLEKVQIEELPSFVHTRMV